MAINPHRPEGASYFNRFTGMIVQAAGAQTPSGEVPAGTVIPGVVDVAFGPLDMPDNAFDNEKLTTIPLDLQIWAQNVEVICKPLDSNISDGVLGLPTWTNDPTTGKPVLHLSLDITALPAMIDVWVTVKHSKVR